MQVRILLLSSHYKVSISVEVGQDHCRSRTAENPGQRRARRPFTGYREVAILPVLETGDRGFESRYPDQFFSQTMR